MHFGHKSRAITLLFLNEIIPLGNEALTNRQMDEGRTDGHSKFDGYNIIPCHFLCGGVSIPFEGLKLCSPSESSSLASVVRSYAFLSSCNFILFHGFM